ncbi:IS3 family transposase, partial [Reinekea sp. G2M2-21]|uniref:IS3 family transposase n=1 Tax=Reinekea sp. G2M2-21 TaxID=2788942 RepID=UPI0018A9BE4D
MCAVYGVSRSGYYAWKRREPSTHSKEDDRLKAVLQDLHRGLKQSYGAPRMRKLLRADGYICSVRRVNRLMRECGLKAITTGLYEWRPGQHAFYAAQGNLIKNLPEPK